MKQNILRILCFCLCVAAVQQTCAQSTPPRPGATPAPTPGRQSTSVTTSPAQTHDRAKPPHDTSKLPREDRQNPDTRHQPNNAPSSLASPRNGLQLGPVGRWWDDKSVVANLGISGQQQRKMDSIFNANRSAIVGSYKNFLKAQEHLQQLNKNAHPDQTQVFSAIDAVNQARADLQKAASAMLLQIRGEMTTEQIEKLGSLR